VLRIVFYLQVAERVICIFVGGQISSKKVVDDGNLIAFIIIIIIIILYIYIYIRY
jgi:hypothetical protein